MDNLLEIFSNLGDNDRLVFFNIFADHDDPEEIEFEFNKYLSEQYDSEELFLTRSDEGPAVIAYKDIRVSIMTNSEVLLAKMKRSIFDGAIGIKIKRKRIKSTFKYNEHYSLSEQEYFLCMN